jgi:hypothetical protein
VVVQHDRYRRPTGISTFPDGGKWRYAERRATLYLVDAMRRTVVTLTRQAAPDHLWESFTAHVRGIEGDSVSYLSLTGCPRGGECHPVLQNELLLRVSRRGGVREAPEVPPGAGLPGVMLARRVDEEHYVRFSVDGAVIMARFEEAGPQVPLFRVRDDGSLEPVERSAP